MEKKMLGNVQIDSNFYHLSNVKQFVDLVNEKMVLNIRHKSFPVSYGSDYYNTYIIVETLDTGYGKREYDIIIKDLLEDNLDLLGEYISEFLKPNTSIKEWYMKEFPDDELGQELKDITFKELYERLDGVTPFNEIVGIGDTIIRERIYTYLEYLVQTKQI